MLRLVSSGYDWLSPTQMPAQGRWQRNAVEMVKGYCWMTLEKMDKRLGSSRDGHRIRGGKSGWMTGRSLFVLWCMRGKETEGRGYWSMTALLYIGYGRDNTGHVLNTVLGFLERGTPGCSRKD